ncbi:hypothetical protein [uncultured Roseibium sp.]|uniref:hypothetical protein n=1 Tax=uncultured Roseibium sp. TaxID=1936171 RepID=UPI00263067D7|nr:hypothetical protein [uncultured Roseibium sp.]
MSGNAPIDKVKHFPVEASFFENESDDKSWINTTISKVYRDKDDDKWKRTNNLSGNDLLKLNAMMPDVISRQHELEHGEPQEQTQSDGMDEIKRKAEEHLAKKSQGQSQDQGHSP